ncbi:MAG: hypothetical protein ACSHXB_08155 [Sulfitobacter sp.]
MTTWTFKGPIAALALLTLSACEGGQGAALFEGLSVPLINGQKAKPLSQIKLASGAVTLVAPRGFCIDSASVQKQFALMARCDVLGVPQAAADAPLAFITVSVLSTDTNNQLPTAQHLAAAKGLSNVTDPKVKDGQLIFRATGPAPIDGVSNTHWRGTSQLGQQIIGVALYGPENGRALSGEGRSIVSTVMSRSQSTL